MPFAPLEDGCGTDQIVVVALFLHATHAQALEVRTQAALEIPSLLPPRL